MIPALNAIKSQLPEAVFRKVSEMEEITQEAFLAEFRKTRKSPLLAFLLWMSFPSFHYFYLGKIWMNIIFWATLGGFGIWWIIDLFRTIPMVRAYNKTIAIGVLKDIQVLT